MNDFRRAHTQRTFVGDVFREPGTGTLRETVHAFLRRSPLVTAFRLGDETSGGWGATIATLKPRN